MVMVVYQDPKACPHCVSYNISPAPAVNAFEGRAYLCHSCGKFTVVRERPEEDKEGEEPALITASFQKCPHCSKIGSLAEAGGYEWCDSCGSDPNETLGSNELSPLWKRGSGIRALMERNAKNLTPDKPIGQFLRLHCGPHCEYETSCEQDSRNLAVCYREWKEEGEEDMGRGRHRRKGKNRHKSSNQAQKSYKKEPHRAHLACAKGGWFEKNIYANQDTKPHRDRGG